MPASDDGIAPERRVRGRLRAALGGLRLRHKLGVSLAIAALLPVLVATWVAVSIILDGLEQGLRDDTDRQLHVGLNLLVRNVERFGQEAAALSESSELRRAMNGRPGSVSSALDRVVNRLPTSVVQVADASGVVQAQRVAGRAERSFEDVAAPPGAEAFSAALRFERRVTIVRVGDELVVRAAAPIVDESYTLLGVVVVSMPLDTAFVEGIRAALGADVLIFAGDGSSAPATTFVDARGAPVAELRVPPALARRVRDGHPTFGTLEVGERSFALGYAPLVDLAGEVIGLFGVAVDRAPLSSARAAAARSLALGGAGALLFALGLAGLLSRRITRPLSRLHEGAMAIARGDLDTSIDLPEGDEIGDLAGAFGHMTSALKENQRRLAARMREIVALHDAGRAVSSVLDLEQVLNKIVDAVARVLHVRVCGLWLVREGGGLTLGAARARGADLKIMRGAEVAEQNGALREVAVEVAEHRTPMRREPGAEGEPASLAVPLERKGSVLGVIVIARGGDARTFAEADVHLLSTFADQAATAVENARLYEAVRAFNEELEAKVHQRTNELMAINSQLAATITELRETQAQLILSERLAGLGMLVAGVAHEVNSPSAAIRGTVDALARGAAELTELAQELSSLALTAAEREEFLELCSGEAPRLARQPLGAPTETRRHARELATRLGEAGIPPGAAAELAHALADLTLSRELAERVAALVMAGGAQAERRGRVVIGYLTQSVYMHRAAGTVGNAVDRIQRIVRGLKSYSHQDQEATLTEADLHEGIESTLTLLDHLLSHGINVTRNYGELPKVFVYVDELNQVWTNLIHNAVQALEGEGHLTIATAVEEGGVVVRVIDDGPGIPAEVLPRIFEPFYTTKRKGEGTGLGLRIVEQIVERHAGRVKVESRPGRTCFAVWLPLERPDGEAA